jgi:hypothetical protein
MNTFKKFMAGTSLKNFLMQTQTIRHQISKLNAFLHNTSIRAVVHLHQSKQAMKIIIVTLACAVLSFTSVTGTK